MADNPSAGCWQRSIVLPSERGSSRLVTDDLLEQLGLFGWSPEEIFAVHLAAEEALVNAAVHGNKLDPLKRVHVECEVSSDLIRLTVTDEGPGFDPEAVPDCTLAERLECASGRGVMLMRSFMSKVEYNAKGNSVVLEKLREPADSDSD